MASSELILSSINSSNYSNPEPFLIYKPTIGNSGFVTTLRLTININSIQEASFPYIPDDTPPNIIQEILNEVAINTEFKEITLYCKKGNGLWVRPINIKIFNKQPYYEVPLMRFFSDANTIDVAEDFSLGIGMKAGYVLALEDEITIYGTAVEEKKNNGNEELAAAIEVLQLAIEGRLTELSPNMLLGRDTTTGTVQQISQSRFANTLNPVFTGIIDNSGGRIKFPLTQVTSTDPNTLDDYEEGSFTPSIFGLTSAGTGTYSIQTGNYTKVGRLIYFIISLNWSSHTGSGEMRIAGLPFLFASSLLAPCSIWSNGLNFSANNFLQAYVGGFSGGVGQVLISQVPAGGGAATAVIVDSAATLMVSGSYFAIN